MSQNAPRVLILEGGEKVIEKGWPESCKDYGSKDVSKKEFSDATENHEASNKVISSYVKSTKDTRASKFH